MLAVAHLELCEWGVAIQHLNYILETTDYEPPVAKCGDFMRTWRTRQPNWKGRKDDELPFYVFDLMSGADKEQADNQSADNKRAKSRRRSEVVAQRAWALRKRVSKLLVRPSTV